MAVAFLKNVITKLQLFPVVAAKTVYNAIDKEDWLRIEVQRESCHSFNNEKSNKNKALKIHLQQCFGYGFKNDPYPL